VSNAVLRLSCVLALGLAATGAAAQSPSSFEQDRKAILAMAGDYHVSFDMRETVALTPGYKPLAPKSLGGEEVVRVIEDTGRTIRLQHLLVADLKGKPYVTKHWRQDWTYEPKEILTYVGPGKWERKPVKPADAKGAWSQTVYQTDDSPRYGGVGRWAYDNGAVRWTSDLSSRPLARRDAVRHPPYDHYDGVNRHTLTPEGWVHEQDNAKIGMKDGKPVTFVHEVVLNSYKRGSDFNVAAADAYWAKTKDYWAAVRLAWDQTLAAKKEIEVAEEAENGSLTGPLLMTLAEDIVDGKTTTAKAIETARPFIASDDAARKQTLAKLE
jgi:hypothetical protein